MEVFTEEEDQALMGKLTLCPRPGCGGEVRRYQPELINVPYGAVMEVSFGQPVSKVTLNGETMGIKTEDLADMSVSDVIWFFNQMMEEENGEPKGNEHQVPVQEGTGQASA